MKTKNKFMGEWTLWKYQPNKDYPSIWYFWVDPSSHIRFCRSIEPVGCMPVNLLVDIYLDVEVEKQPIAQRDFLVKNLKRVNHKMNQEQLSQGWLCK